jgi:hypothetical protein
MSMWQIIGQNFRLIPEPVQQVYKCCRVNRRRVLYPQYPVAVCQIKVGDAAREVSVDLKDQLVCIFGIFYISSKNFNHLSDFGILHHSVLNAFHGKKNAKRTHKVAKPFAV